MTAKQTKQAWKQFNAEVAANIREIAAARGFKLYGTARNYKDEVEYTLMNTFILLNSGEENCD